MGNSQSTQKEVCYSQQDHDKALLERLRSMNLDKKDEQLPPYTSDPDSASANEKPRPGVVVAARQLRSRTPEGLSVPAVGEWQTHLLRQPKHLLAIQAFTKASPRDVLSSVSTKIRDQHVFNVTIPLEGAPVTNQRSSGRCWLFASTNVFRVALMRKYNLEAFELSQAYLFFWDKLEKSNWFLEQVLDTAGEELDGRLVQHLLREPISDGGQWDMVFNLVEKYGLVPQALYPDSWNAMNSGVVNSIVISKLREYAVVLREMVGREGVSVEMVRERKTAMVREIHKILTLTLGPPPGAEEEFVWEFVDSEGKARSVRATPRGFARDIESEGRGVWPAAGRKEVRITREGIAGMLSLVHDPRHEGLTHLSVDRLGNIVGGRGVRYVNVDMATLKAACVKQLEAGIPVFFGCDVGKFSDSNGGVMDLDLFDYEVGFGIKVMGRGEKKKAERLRTGESQMTHAMVLTAVHVEDGKPVRWRVQNSWGEARGEKGWFVMSDAWMDEFTYQAVIDPRFVEDKVRDVLDQEPVVLPLWDPMGSLA
ncbi:peptidase C1-like family protein [Coniochaeta ligniaria NRRL 30616]|uniref:Cysteine proteinase 1, mitochondrial n=1 Tax=Coniochaeta ligniaria NRRL 30616 TaxID=1408157 RepID=A0A1J7JU00_9PEZI|nr:peptidase C1-like family protein [Coniochaeta ligniaria NRRL 30616]